MHICETEISVSTRGGFFIMFVTLNVYGVRSESKVIFRGGVGEGASGEYTHISVSDVQLLFSWAEVHKEDARRRERGGHLCKSPVSGCSKFADKPDFTPSAWSVGQMWLHLSTWIEFTTK